MQGKRLDASAITKKIYKGPVLVALGILVIITLSPPFAPYVGELPARILGLTSNHPIRIYSNSKTGRDWPSAIREDCTDYSCWTVPVIVTIDFGKYLYIRPKKGGDIYRLERKGIVEQHMRSSPILNTDAQQSTPAKEINPDR
jgi:hypothetical protein